MNIYGTDVDQLKELAENLLTDGYQKSSGFRVFETGDKAAFAYEAAAALWKFVAVHARNATERTLAASREGDAKRAAEWCMEQYTRSQAALKLESEQAISRALLEAQ